MMSVLAQLIPMTCVCRLLRDSLSSSIILRIALTDPVFRTLQFSIHACSLYALSLESVARSIQTWSSPIRDMFSPSIPHIVMFFPSIISWNVHILEKYRLWNSDLTWLMHVE